MDYVPSLFAYKPSLAEAVQRQKTERQERAVRRRQLAQEQEMEAQRTATAEALMMAETHYVSTQTPFLDSGANTETTGTRMTEAVTQTPQVGYFDASTQTDDICPQETREPTRTGIELIEGNNTKTRFFMFFLCAFDVCLACIWFIADTPL